MSRYTRNRFEPDFLENETSCNKQIFVTVPSFYFFIKNRFVLAYAQLFGRSVYTKFS